MKIVKTIGPAFSAQLPNDLTNEPAAKTAAQEWEGLKRKTASAITWMLVAAGWTSVASFFVFAMLARILGPEPFGVYALATAAFQILSTIALSGVNDAVIQQKELDEELADTLFWTNLAISIVLGLGLFLCAGLYAAWSRQPMVEPVLKSLALILPVEGLAGVHMARKLRDFGHRVISLRMMTASLVGGGAAIACALAGWGVWSLVIQAWTSSILNAIFAWSSFRWIPGFRFSFRRMLPVLAFGGSLIVTRVLWLIQSGIQDILISRFLGAPALGAYRVAWRLIELAGQIVAQPIGSVALATFSSIQEETTKFEAAYGRLIGLASLAMFPLVIAVGVLANDIIPFLFGRTWADVGPVAQMLSVMVVPFTLNYFIGCATAARGAPQAGVSVAALQLVLTVILSYLAAPFGLIAVAAAFVLRSYLVLPYQQYVLYKYTGVDPIRALRSILPPLVSAVVMGGSMIVLRPVIHAHCEIPQIYIGVQIASSATSYVVCLLLIGRAQLKLHLRALFDLARRS